MGVSNSNKLIDFKKVDWNFKYSLVSLPSSPLKMERGRGEEKYCEFEKFCYMIL